MIDAERWKSTAIGGSLDRVAGEIFLASHGWLSVTSEAFRRGIFEVCEWRDVDVGEPLMLAGDPPGGIFGLANGAASAFTAFSAPDAPMVYLQVPGMWLGEGCILNGNPRKGTVVARLPTVIASVSLPALRTLLASRPEWWRHIGQLAEMNFDIAISRVADMTIRDPYRRCVALMLRLGGSRFNDAPNLLSPQLRLTQDELAAMSNLSRSTVNTIARRLAERDLIEVGFGSIAIIDAAELRRIADGD